MATKTARPTVTVTARKSRDGGFELWLDGLFRCWTAGGRKDAKNEAERLAREKSGSDAKATVIFG